MTPFIVGMICLLVGGWTVQWAAWIGLRRRTLCVDRRLGLLGTGEAPSAEACRAARLVELRCGEILHVDYERGQLICAKEPRHYR